MDGDEDIWNRLAMIGDAFVVACALALSVAVTTLSAGHPVRVLVTLPTLLLAPGYTATLAVFPGTEPSTDDSAIGRVRSMPDRPAGLDGVERAALSFGLSVASLPLVAMGLALGDIGFDTMPVIGGVATLTAALLTVGLIRRYCAPPTFRYAPSPRALYTRIADLTAPGSTETMLNVALVLAAASAIATLGIAVSAPQDGASYTQVNLLTENVDGDRAAVDYPTNLTRNETGETRLEVVNHEDGPTPFTVVVRLQQVGAGGTVTARSELDRFEIDTEPETTTRVRHEFQISRVGEDQRVAYLLYRGDAPAEPAIDSAYRKVYLWVDVQPVGGASTTADTTAVTAGNRTTTTAAGETTTVPENITDAATTGTTRATAGNRTTTAGNSVLPGDGR
jgi:uncharacterized membrane protein